MADRVMQVILDSTGKIFFAYGTIKNAFDDPWILANNHFSWVGIFSIGYVGGVENLESPR